MHLHWQKMKIFWRPSLSFSVMHWQLLSCTCIGKVGVSLPVSLHLHP
jgi:hypothetical protein